jgi:hypothetical protein
MSATGVDPLAEANQASREAGDPEMRVAFDMVRRSLPFIPLLCILGAVGWGVNGALSTGYGIVVVLANFVLAAALLAWSARISVVFLAVGAFGGFFIRLSLIFLAVMVVRDAAWVELVPLGLTLIVTHVGLLFWELRYVSISLAHPGLKPAGEPVRAS